jgi:hypothetical protein
VPQVGLASLSIQEHGLRPTQANVNNLRRLTFASRLFDSVRCGHEDAGFDRHAPVKNKKSPHVKWWCARSQCKLHAACRLVSLRNSRNV